MKFSSGWYFGEHVTPIELQSVTLGLKSVAGTMVVTVFSDAKQATESVFLAQTWTLPKQHKWDVVRDTLTLVGKGCKIMAIFSFWYTQVCCRAFQLNAELCY